MKKILLLSILFHVVAFSQNKQVLYDFAALPQTGMLNPGAELRSNVHIGIPMLSDIEFKIGFSGFSVYDLFEKGVDINDRLRAEVSNFGRAEFAEVHEQLHLLNVGIRLANTDYLSFGFYQELDMGVKIPKDLVDLFYEGNTDINRHYGIDHLGARMDLIGVLHLGLSRKINEKLQVGFRGKIYSSAANLSSKRNRGSLYTTTGVNNQYNQQLKNIHFLLQSAGVFYEENEEPSGQEVFSKLVFGKDMGLGLDLGFTYHLKDQWILSASLLDIGFVSHSEDVESYQLLGDFEVEGLQLLYNPDNHEDYWNDLNDEFENSVTSETLHEKYTTWRPVKLNASLSYNFGRPYTDDCRYIIDKKLYRNKLGAHLFSSMSSVHTYFAATLFYEKRFSQFLSLKTTYTMDSFTFSNVGFGLSTKLGVFNTYITLDNILNMPNIYDSKSLSLQFGMQFIFNN